MNKTKIKKLICQAKTTLSGVDFFFTCAKKQIFVWKILGEPRWPTGLWLFVYI